MGLPRKEKEPNWFIEFIEDYSQFFRRDNWYTFRFWLFEVENDWILGGWEATFILLGIGARWRWNHTETSFTIKLNDEVAKIRRERSKE